MPESLSSSVVKIPLKVNQKQGQILDGQSKICNWLYNHLLDHANQLKKEYIETQDSSIVTTLYTERGLRNLLPGLKKDKLFLKTVYSSVLKNTALRLSASIQTHQKSRKGKRKGKKTGWPRFRSWTRGWFSLLYEEPNKGFRIENSTLKLSLGSGVERSSRYLYLPLQSVKGLKNKEVRNLRIVKQSGLFYAVFTVRYAIPKKKNISKVIALDPNHKNLAYGVSNDNQAIEIAAARWLKSMDLRIDALQSKRDRCKKKSQQVFVDNEKFYWKPSRRWQFFQNKMDKLRRKRREQTKTFLFTLAHALFRKYDLVAIGDYTPDGQGLNSLMRRSLNNQSLIARFKEILEWVALKSGRHFYEFNEKGTTRTCHHCNHIVDGGLAPAIRKWECAHCQAEHIRDENASQNGLRRVLRDLQLENLLPGSGLASVVKRWAWRALPSGVEQILRGSCSSVSAAPRNLNEGVVALD